MSYIVDFVLGTMRDLSSSEPILFQRDGSLYVVSQEGFGQVTHGLSTRPEEIPTWQKRQQRPEILASEDMFAETDGSRREIVESEKPYVRAIAFGPDTDVFSLEDMAKRAEALAELPDDEKIRMILHDSSYHSHKGGYGADGMDFWVQEARVMDKDRYLTLVRNREDELVGEIERAITTRCEGDKEIAFNSLYKLNGVVLTPNMLVSLPRAGQLSARGERSDSWTIDTRLEQQDRGPAEQSSVLNQRNVDTYCESPFGINIVLNSQRFSPANADELLALRNGIIGHINEDLAAVHPHMPAAEGVVARLNELHKRMCAEDIEQSKKWKQESDESRAAENSAAQ